MIRLLCTTGRTHDPRDGLSAKPVAACEPRLLRYKARLSTSLRTGLDRMAGEKPGILSAGQYLPTHAVAYLHHFASYDRCTCHHIYMLSKGLLCCTVRLHDPFSPRCWFVSVLDDYAFLHRRPACFSNHKCCLHAQLRQHTQP